jgi:DNA-binding NtrC family response regulator
MKSENQASVLDVIAQLSQPRKVLVVNSDQNTQNLFKEFAQGKNCLLDFASVEEAEFNYTPERYDVVIIDIAVAHSGATKAFHTIRERSPKKSIYVMSDITPVDLWDTAKSQNRFVAFVPKPNTFNFEFIGQLFEALSLVSA